MRNRFHTYPFMLPPSTPKRKRGRPPLNRSSGVSPLIADGSQNQDGAATLGYAATANAAPTGHKTIPQVAAQGHSPQNTSSPEGVKQGGKLPNGWRIARVGDILKVRNGYAFKSTDYKTEGVPLIRQTDLRDDVVSLAEAKRVDPHFLNALPGFVVRDGDLLIGMSGSLGKIARYQHEKPSMQNQRTGLLMVKPEHEPNFAKLVLKFVEPQILAEGKGIAVQNVSAKQIEDCTFPLPPFHEQRRIVAEIEKQFTRLDAGVSALRRVQANLKRYRAAVLKAACEGKLVPTEAELHRQGKSKSTKFESGTELLDRILSERRKKWTGRGKYKEPAAPDSANLIPLPKGWTWANVDQLGDVGTGATPKKQNSEYYQGGEIPWITSSALNRTNIDSANECVTEKALAETNLTIFPAGTLLVAMYGEGKTRGKCAELRICATTNQAIAGIQCPAAIRGYLKLSLWSQYESMRLAASGGVQPNLNLSLVRAIRIPLPPVAEQTRIVAEVERRLSVMEELDSVVTANLLRAARLRQSILQKAFTGKL